MKVLLGQETPGNYIVVGEVDPDAITTDGVSIRLDLDVLAKVIDGYDDNSQYMYCKIGADV
jgi:hypothetical protein